MRDGVGVRVVIGGAGGFLGSALVAALLRRGDTVVKLVRRPATAPDEAAWDPASGRIDPRILEGCDAVVNLGGVGIGDRRWSPAHKRAVLDSRLEATSTLAGTLESLDAPPRIFVSASAVGFYGDRGDETLTEESAPGPSDDFLVHVTQRWEEAAIPAVAAGATLALARTGIVLGPGGVLGRLLLPFKLGLGGRMGHGRQWWSWIALEDQVRATLYIIDKGLGGAFNLTAPAPVRNLEFAKSLGRALRRPAIVPLPEIALNAVLGKERAQALVFTSAKVQPRALQAAGFEFAHPELDAAWPAILG